MFASNENVGMLSWRTILVNALLIYSGFPYAFWNFRHALKFIGKKCAFSPLEFD
jgi:hypothetical protein